MPEISKLHQTLQDNVAKAIESQLDQEAQPRQTKRPRMESTRIVYSSGAISIGRKWRLTLSIGTK